MNSWRVECQATSLVSGEHEIPPERLSWERFDRYGRRVGGANLGTSRTIIEGFGATAESEVRVRFSLHVTLQDKPLHV